MKSDSTYALTGANGFLGWHVKLALQAYGCRFVEIPLGEPFSLQQATAALDTADHVIHMAGVNRGTEDEIAEGNVQFATQLSLALQQSEKTPDSVTYANSTQSGNETVYGVAKRAAGEILSATSAKLNVDYRDITLPNLFGEHGRPFYNSVVATFCHLLATGEGEPSVQQDTELRLLHAQDAADWLIGNTDNGEGTVPYRAATVSELASRLREISTTYSKGEIPDISDAFSRDLFNTYRSFLPRNQMILTEHADNRGSFVEMVRTWGGTGQSSFSTTHPGISRGDHFHRRKVERFVVISGKARLQLRRLFTDEIVEIVTDGRPVALDQPTGWTHNLLNIGDDTLFMFFWTNDIFDPNNTDTFMEPV